MVRGEYFFSGDRKQKICSEYLRRLPGVVLGNVTHITNFFPNIFAVLLASLSIPIAIFQKYFSMVTFYNMKEAFYFVMPSGLFLTLLQGKL